ncbi:polysaccharide deacetylase family protein [Sinobaca sp. H24]|uniref:polysaccharide deacetylase family protein n=1 Tax=Sinobaca sp. H24 TaxID=2923376 RepID=UPI0027E27E36|nr:polysaccharide deacetylase family protein [Sinobaca sp. H24]
MKKFMMISFTALVLAGCSNSGQENSEAEEAEETDAANEAAEQEETDTESEPAQEEEQQSDNAAAYSVNEADASLQAETETENPAVLLTIDDAPDTYGVEMAEKLKERDIPAIFFVNGHFINDEEGKKDLQAIYDMGFEIGNHTMSHPDLTSLSEEEQKTEIVELNNEIEEITGEKPQFFPCSVWYEYGVFKSADGRRDMIWMNWTYGYDWEPEYQNAEALADIMVNTELVRDGANLLMHDREWTNEALPEIIDGFEENGYDFIDPDHIESN